VLLELYGPVTTSSLARILHTNPGLRLLNCGQHATDFALQNLSVGQRAHGAYSVFKQFAEGRPFERKLFAAPDCRPHPENTVGERITRGHLERLCAAQFIVPAVNRRRANAPASRQSMCRATQCVRRTAGLCIWHVTGPQAERAGPVPDTARKKKKVMIFLKRNDEAVRYSVFRFRQWNQYGGGRAGGWNVMR